MTPILSHGEIHGFGLTMAGKHRVWTWVLSMKEYIRGSVAIKHRQFINTESQFAVDILLTDKSGGTVFIMLADVGDSNLRMTKH